MNDEQAKALGMLAKTLPGFSWQPRMMNGRTDRCAVAVLVEEGAGPWVLWEPEGSWYDFKDDWHVLDPDDWPDFRDPPTMGWLLHQVREAWGDPHLFVESAIDAKTEKWVWWVNIGAVHAFAGQCPSDIEALLYALGTAPEQNAATPREPHTSEEGARCPQ